MKGRIRGIRLLLPILGDRGRGETFLAARIAEHFEAAHRESGDRKWGRTKFEIWLQKRSRVRRKEGFSSGKEVGRESAIAFEAVRSLGKVPGPRKSLSRFGKKSENCRSV